MNSTQSSRDVLPLSKDERWLGVALRFDTQPAAYAHPSWLPLWAGESPQPLSPRIERELSTWLLAQQAVSEACDWSACCRAARLFMLGPRERHALALATGVAAHRTSLRQVVVRERIEVLRSGLGDALDTLWSPLAECVDHAERRLVLPLNAGGIDALRLRLHDDGLCALLRLLNSDDALQRDTAARAAFCAPRSQALVAAHGLPSQQAERLSEALVEFAIPRWASTCTWLF